MFRSLAVALIVSTPISAIPLGNSANVNLANIDPIQAGKNNSGADVRAAMVSGNQANVQQNNAVVQEIHSNGTVIGTLQNVNITDLSTNNITNVNRYNHTTNEYTVNYITEERILNEYKNIVYEQAAVKSGIADTDRSSVLQRLKDAVRDAKYLIDALFK